MNQPRAKIKSKDSKRARSFNSGSSNGMLDIQDKHMFMKLFYNQVPFELRKALDYMVSNCNPIKGTDISSLNKKTTCAKCGKGYFGECLIGMGNCIGCGKSGNKVRDCPNVKGEEKSSGQDK